MLQNLAEIAGRVCLHEGSLLELDPVDGMPLKRIHAYLFNDVLMIASWLANGGRRGPPRYKMQAVYNLQSLAVVNIRDLGTVKLAFKLLAFPDTRVFQCATATSKVSVIQESYLSNIRNDLREIICCRRNGWTNANKQREPSWHKRTEVTMQIKINFPRKNKPYHHARCLWNQTH